MIIFLKVGHTQMFLIELQLFDFLWEKCFGAGGKFAFGID